MKNAELDLWYYDDKRRGRYETVSVKADLMKTETVTAPGHSWERKTYRHNVQVYVSPTGRSVQIFVNGNKVYPNGDSRSLSPNDNKEREQ